MTIVLNTFEFPRIYEESELTNETGSKIELEILDLKIKMKDQILHSFFAEINSDPQNYEQAMSSKERNDWKRAVDVELNSMEKNNVWMIINRPTSKNYEKRPNIIDSKWVFKKKNDVDDSIKYEARLVIRGFKDKNLYELTETYAPVSRLPLVRAVLAIINYYDLEACQLDVKTAFLNDTIKEDMFMEIPEGMNISEETKRTKVCKLQKSLYGLKISPKRWNEKFTEVAKSMGLQNDENDPCLFTLISKTTEIILLLYVDDIILASND